MPFCRNCGNEVFEEAEYCPSCGTAARAASLIMSYLIGALGAEVKDFH